MVGSSKAKVKLSVEYKIQPTLLGKIKFRSRRLIKFMQFDCTRHELRGEWQIEASTEYQTSRN